MAKHRPTPIKKYLIHFGTTTLRIDSPLFAHQVISEKFPDVVGHGKVCEGGLEFLSRTQGRIYITWVDNAST